METNQSVKFELRLHPKQNGGVIKGFDLEKYLEETGLINRAFSLEDRVVKGWLANPATYPAGEKEFKYKTVCLWKSRNDSYYGRSVAYLYNGFHGLTAGWHLLEREFGSNDPALLVRLNDT